MCVYIYTYVRMYVYMYIYIYIIVQRCLIIHSCTQCRPQAHTENQSPAGFGRLGTLRAASRHAVLGSQAMYGLNRECRVEVYLRYMLLQLYYEKHETMRLVTAQAPTTVDASSDPPSMKQAATLQPWLRHRKSQQAAGNKCPTTEM